jgi:SWI/SNF-related matrix-associated actin-dependent regulator of chromatin subfamily A-like protein 1
MTDNHETLGTIRVLCEKQGKKQWYRLRFPYNQTLIDKIKAFPREEREWDGVDKSWVLTTTTLFFLLASFTRDSGYWFDFGTTEARDKFVADLHKIRELDEEKKRILIEIEQKNKEAVEFKEYIEQHTQEYVERIHAKIKTDFTLYSFQIAAVMYLDKVKNALLAFEMGLGKTLSSIAYTEYEEYEKALIIVPNSLKFNFYGEVEKFTFSKAHIVNWKNNWHSVQDSKYIIVNYDYFRDAKWESVKLKFDALGIGKVDVVICDESQKLKNSKANTTKNIKKLLKILKPKSKVFLSGTPMPNRAFELYTVLNEISPIEFATKKHFYEYYCGMSYNQYTGQYDTDISGARFEELFRKIAPHNYRKRKTDVLDLPDKIYRKTMVELTEKEYRNYCLTEAGVANEIFGQEKMSGTMIITIMLRLRQFTSKIKLPVVQELIESILEGGEKVVVLDMFKESLYELKGLFGDIAAVHTGDQSVDERGEIVKTFQNPESNLKIFLGSIQTCNYGLTLTAASKMIINTMPWSVGEYDQATDRIHRIGTKNTVFIYPLIGKGTIDEMVFDKIEDKRSEINKVIDNEDYKSSVDESVLSEILSQLKGKYGRKKEGS